MTPSTTGDLRADGARRGVRFERLYKATAEELWSALTRPEQLARWLTHATLEATAGGQVRFDFGDDGDCTGEILVWDPPQTLEYEWRFAGEDESVVRWELHDAEGGTLLVLDHRRLGADQATGYAAGWHAHLDVLEGYLAGTAVSWQQRFDALLSDYRATSADA